MITKFICGILAQSPVLIYYAENVNLCIAMKSPNQKSNIISVNRFMSLISYRINPVKQPSTKLTNPKYLQKFGCINKYLRKIRFSFIPGNP